VKFYLRLMLGRGVWPWPPAILMRRSRLAVAAMIAVPTPRRSTSARHAPEAGGHAQLEEARAVLPDEQGAGFVLVSLGLPRPTVSYYVGGVDNYKYYPAAWRPRRPTT